MRSRSNDGPLARQEYGKAAASPHMVRTAQAWSILTSHRCVALCLMSLVLNGLERFADQYQTGVADITRRIWPNNSDS
jgi:hypothetical protein